MLFSVGYRSDVNLFQNNWNKSDCWTERDYITDSTLFANGYFFSRHFTWGDEFNLNSSWGHWAGDI